MEKLGDAPRHRDAAETEAMESLRRAALKAHERMDELLGRGNLTHNRETIASVQRATWRNFGVLEHGFGEAQLDQVIEELAIVKKVPVGYLYPSLLLSDSLPGEMLAMLQRKAEHALQK